MGTKPETEPTLGGRFRCFYFFCSGKGKEESEVSAGGGGVRFLIENPKDGGRGAWGGGGLRRIGELWGGGPNIFFRG